MKAVWTLRGDILESLHVLLRRNCGTQKGKSMLLIMMLLFIKSVENSFTESFLSSCSSLKLKHSELLVETLEQATLENVIWEKNPKLRTNLCRVLRNGTYRSLESYQEVDNETPICLLSEEPLLSTPIADCIGCQSATLGFDEVGGPLLVEHVVLALAISLADPALENLVLSELCSGLVPNESRGQRCWPLRFLMVASTLSSIAAIVLTKRTLWHSSGENGPCNYPEILSLAERLFALLVRIPANTHAVSQLVSDRAETFSTLSQRRVGYSIFLGASAVNHSCNPNASFRYCFRAGQETSPLQLFRGGVQIEMRYTSSVPMKAGQELCVSYGPLKGRMTLAQRRDVLVSQYLFLCRCTACAAEQEEVLGRASGSEENIPREQTQWGLFYDLQTMVSALTDEYFQQQLQPEAISLFEQRLHLLVRNSSVYILTGI